MDGIGGTDLAGRIGGGGIVEAIVTARVVIAIATVFAVAGCGGETRQARVRYNEGVAALAAGNLDDAEKAFLAARDVAGWDHEVRFRAGFDLALTFAQKGDKAAAAGPDRDVDVAIERYRDALGWFTDARRLKPGDAETQANLERVRARMLALVDEANRGENGLEPRLEKLIAGERGLRDQARGLWMGQEARAAGADPLADRDGFEATATRQRALAAEAGVVADLAGDEITAIGGKAEAERTDEEKVRVEQLKGVDVYVQEARKAMTDARRNLHELRGELAHTRSDAALEALKRAREQLLDPVAVMQAVAQDQVQLEGYTSELELRQRVRIDGGALAPVPGWMTAPKLANRRIGLRSRLSEVESRLGTALAAKAARVEAQKQPGTQPGAQPDAKPPDPKYEKLLGQVAAAMPAVAEASTGMKQGYDTLMEGNVSEGVAAERRALVALGKAIEQFLDLRRLIDVSVAEQRMIVAALKPAVPGDPAGEISNEDRARILGEGPAKNKARLVRMSGEIADALAEAEAKAAQPPAASAAPVPTEPDPALDQERQLYAKAETLRGEALAAIERLGAATAGGKGVPALESATAAEAKLVELQKLFFSVIEHLKELIEQQGSTRDQTAKALVEDDVSRQPMLTGIIGREREHAAMADGIAKALAEQADAAAAQASAAAQAPGQGGAAPNGPNPQAIGEAAGEVRNALTSMQDVVETLMKATDPSQQISVDLQPGLDEEQAAIDHLENALRLLQPPKQQKPPEQDEQKDPEQQEQQEQQQQQKQQEQSAEDAQRRLQQVREREAQRDRERRQRPQPSDPVDKDW